MDADRARWDERWRSNGPAVEAVRPTPPDIVASEPSTVDRIPTAGRALDLACGAGAQALWMATRGLDVVALDVSPVAIDLTRQAAEQAGVDVDARVWDTDDGLPADLVDLSLIVCQRFRATALYVDLFRRLAPGGVLVLTVLSAVGLDGEAGPFHAPAGELTATFTADAVPGAVVLVDVEADGQASIVVQRSA